MNKLHYLQHYQTIFFLFLFHLESIFRKTTTGFPVQSGRTFWQVWSLPPVTGNEPQNANMTKHFSIFWTRVGGFQTITSKNNGIVWLENHKNSYQYKSINYIFLLVCIHTGITLLLFNVYDMNHFWITIWTPFVCLMYI